MQLQVPICGYRSQELAAGAMVLLQEARCVLQEQRYGFLSAGLVPGAMFFLYYCAGSKGL